MHPALGKPVPVEYSARHIHLSQEDQDMLFGPGYEMTVRKELSQRKQFAYEEKVTVRGTKGEFQVRVLGPVREKTQLELAWSDGRRIGAATPVRISGDVEDSGGGVVIIGPAGEVTLEEGVINDQRHLHASVDQAAELGLKNGDRINVLLPGKTPIVVNDLVVRVSPDYDLAVHIDTDEANASSLEGQRLMGEIISVHPQDGQPEHYTEDL